MALQLRPYQSASIQALYDYWGGGGGNGLIVLPTGAGKSLVIAELCRTLLEFFPRMRIGVITHVRELVEQNAMELMRLWPQGRHHIGIYSAGLGRRDLHSRILFMSIQSVHKKVELLRGFDLILVDEAHLIPRSADTMYGRFIKACRSLIPDMRLAGLTATPYRLDSGRLDRGKDRLFDEIVYEAHVGDLIRDGYLSKLISKATLSEIDVSGVHVRGGEFIAGELERAAMVPSIVQAAVKELVELGAERRGWLSFCSGVEHAVMVRDEIRDHGISCEVVTGDTPAGERASIIRRYKAREIRCLTSVAVLTTGFNAPHVDLIAMMRPTLSTGLYVQMVGRGFRLADGKDDCLVLDYAGNVRRHGPIDAVVPKGSSKGKGEGEDEPEEPETKVKANEVRAKQCPDCNALHALNVLTCEHCGFAWPLPPARHEAKAEDVAILSTERPAPAALPQWVGVKSTHFFEHHKEGSVPSVRVEHLCGMKVQREWWCFEHQGFARERAHRVWRQLGGHNPPPRTVDEALDRIEAGELQTITAIRIKTKLGSKYEEVVAHQSEAAKSLAQQFQPALEDEEIPF